MTFAPTPEPEDWQREAACLGRDPEIFFPGQGESLAPAKAVCAICTVRGPCLELGINEAHGVFGGTSEAERRRIRRQRTNATRRAS